MLNKDEMLARTSNGIACASLSYPLIVDTALFNRLPVNDILYLESHRRIIVMHLLDEKRPAYQFYGNITELSEKIEPLGFLRIQKSYLVNMHYVEIFQYNKVQLRGGLCLAPSEKNYNELKQKYLHWRGKSRWML